MLLTERRLPTLTRQYHQGKESVRRLRVLNRVSRGIKNKVAKRDR